MATGSDIVKIARQHVGERYVLGSAVDYDDALFKGPWDCAEFASWCLYQAAHIQFGVRQESTGLDAYSGYWTEDAHKLGTIVRWQEAAIVPGAFLVRSPGTHPVHPSGHVVICQGENQTIEAMDTKHGVVEGKTANRIWDMGVLVSGIDYSKAALTSFPNVPIFSLRAGNPMARGPLVTRVAKQLSSLGHYAGEPTNHYGVELASAVIKYQLKMGLVADGEVGKRTFSRLFPARAEGAKEKKGRNKTRGKR